MKKNSLFSPENIALFITLAAVFLFMWYMIGPRFIGGRNLNSMAYQLPIVGLLSVGMMIAMLTGGINLSIIANANLNGIVIWLVLEAFTGKGHMKEAGIFPIVVAVLAGFLVSAVVGFVNGYLISKFEIPDILVTLGTMTLISGVNVVLTRGSTITGFPAALNFIGNGQIGSGIPYIGSIPFPFILFIAAVAATSVILNRTRFGFSLYMMGANPVAAKYSSVNLVKITIMQYVFSAFFASLTSLVMIGQLNSVKANYAESYLLVAVLASFFGGVDPNGGFGKISGVFTATIILQLISSGLNLMRMDPFMITAMWGAIVILVIFAKAAAATIRKHWGGGRTA